MENILDVFEIDAENIKIEDDVKKDNVYYSPKQEGKEPYTALVRFLPIAVKENGEFKRWLKEEKPYFKRNRYWLTDENGNGDYYDSPSTIPGQKCPIQQTFFRLRGSDDVNDKKRSNELRMSTHYWGLVYIIADKQNPDLVGKVLIWRFNNTIEKMIAKELDPNGHLSEYATPKPKVAVWDFVKGKNLALVVGQSKVPINGKETILPNFEASEFIDSSPLEVDGKPVGKDNVEGVQKIIDLIPEQIMNEQYKPWDDETREQVERILSKYNSSNSFVETPSVSTDSMPDLSSNSNSEADDLLKELNFDQ